MRVLITGADGFLGWHLRCRFHGESGHTVVAANRENWAELATLMQGVDAVFHVAGVNRGADDELLTGNTRLAEDVVAAAEASGARPHVVYANSIQCGNGTPYGIGKEAAAQVLEEATHRWGTTLSDLRLPNLFGESARPGYNSFVATFVDAVLNGDEPSVVSREINLLHVQDAAAAMMAAVGDRDAVSPAGHATSVEAVWELLRSFHQAYCGRGDVPALPDRFVTDLFNTYRAALFPQGYPIALTKHTDARGSLVETVRSHGLSGQSFVSTTHPGITRGEHYHRRKIERFVVVSGTARISLRRLFDTKTVHFDVTGDSPSVIDMPTLWVHNITNTGDEELVTQFWTNTLFDPQDPDTYPARVSARDEYESE